MRQPQSKTRLRLAVQSKPNQPTPEQKDEKRKKIEAKIEILDKLSEEIYISEKINLQTVIEGCNTYTELLEMIYSLLKPNNRGPIKQSKKNRDKFISLSCEILNINNLFVFKLCTSVLNSKNIDVNSSKYAIDAIQFGIKKHKSFKHLASLYFKNEESSILLANGILANSMTLLYRMCLPYYTRVKVDYAAAMYHATKMKSLLDKRDETTYCGGFEYLHEYPEPLPVTFQVSQQACLSNYYNCLLESSRNLLSDKKLFNYFKLANKHEPRNESRHLDYIASQINYYLQNNQYNLVLESCEVFELYSRKDFELLKQEYKDYITAKRGEVLTIRGRAIDALTTELNTQLSILSFQHFTASLLPNSKFEISKKDETNVDFTTLKLNLKKVNLSISSQAIQINDWYSISIKAITKFLKGLDRTITNQITELDKRSSSLETNINSISSMPSSDEGSKNAACKFKEPEELQMANLTLNAPRASSVAVQKVKLKTRGKAKTQKSTSPQDKPTPTILKASDYGFQSEDFKDSPVYPIYGGDVPKGVYFAFGLTMNKRPRQLDASLAGTFKNILTEGCLVSKGKGIRAMDSHEVSKRQDLAGFKKPAYQCPLFKLSIPGKDMRIFLEPVEQVKVNGNARTLYRAGIPFTHR